MIAKTTADQSATSEDDLQDTDELTISKSGTPKRRKSKSFRRYAAAWSRWLHIYLSMFGLAVILFFSVTGLTLNHQDWFFDEQLITDEGSMNTAWLNINAPPPEGWDEYDFGHEVSRLDVVEHLREQHGLRGKVTDFLAFEDECEVTFQSPGYSATARIQRKTGEYHLDVLSNDLVTVLNDLHKGRNSGKAWSWVIDVSAVIGILSSLTGFILIFFLRLRRRSALAVSIGGLLTTWGLYQMAIG